MPIIRKFPIQDQFVDGDAEPALRDVPWEFVDGHGSRPEDEHGGLKILNRVVGGVDNRGKTLDDLAAAGGITLGELYLHARRAGHHDAWPAHATADQMRRSIRSLM